MDQKGIKNHGRPQLFWKGGGARIGQGAPFDCREYVVRFRPIQPVGGGGWCCPLLGAFGPIQPVGGGGVLSAFGPIQPLGGGGGGSCPLSADSTSGGGGGGGGGVAVAFGQIQSIRCLRFRQIRPVGGGRWKLTFGGMRMYVNKMGGGTIRGGGRHSVTCLPPLLPGDAHENARYLYMHCSYVHCYMYVILSKHCHFQFVMQVIFA